MKKYLWILIPVFLLFVSGCSDEETQQISCAIQVPSDGETIQVRAGEKLFIRGYGKTDHGQIVSAELKVAGSVIPDVTTVPFYYGYSLPEDQAAGELKVELTVQGETGVTASTSSTVILAIDLGPQPPKVGTMTDSRDGIVYKTVQLGNQLWMAENLRYLPQQDYDVSSTDPKYYVMLDYDATTELGQGFLDAYGAYYNVPAALQGHALQSMESTQKIQGVCPAGWHLPSKAEWKVLEEFVAAELPGVDGNGWYDEFDTFSWIYESGLKNVWGALAGKEGWGVTSMGDENPDLKKGPQDTYGLNLIPSGSSSRMEDLYGNWWNITTSSTSFWTTDVQSSGNGYVQYDNMSYRPTYSKFGTNPVIGYSVRCVKD